MIITRSALRTVTKRGYPAGVVGFLVVLAMVGSVLVVGLLYLALCWVVAACARARIRSRTAALGSWAEQHGWTYRTRAWVLRGHPWVDHTAESAGVDGDPLAEHVLETERDGLPVLLTERRHPAPDRESSGWTEVRGSVDLPLTCTPVVINPGVRRPERRVHLLDDDLDARVWVEADDPVAGDELLLGAHDLLRTAKLPPAWRVTIDRSGPRVSWTGELTGHAAAGAADLLVGLAEALPDDALRAPARARGTRR